MESDPAELGDPVTRQISRCRHRRRRRHPSTRRPVDAAKCQAAAAWREAQQTCVGNTAEVIDAKWQAAAAWRKAQQTCVGSTAEVIDAKWQAAAAWR